MTTDEILNWPLSNKIELMSIFSKKTPLIIFDIGACDGIDSIKYSTLFPNSIIYCFEPLPNNLQELTTNIEKYKINNIKACPEALSNTIGTAIFHVSSGHPTNISSQDNWDYGKASSSLLNPSNNIKKAYDWLKFEKQVTVNTNIIDNFCSQHKISSIDFIHMDVQGAELMVLEGAQNSLNKIKAIWLEVEKIELYQNQPLKNDIEKFMFNNKFIKVKDTVGEIDGNQLYLNKEKFNITSIQIIFQLNYLKNGIKKISKKIIKQVFPL
jgi:FkbM family methyltransferase